MKTTTVNRRKVSAKQPSKRVFSRKLRECNLCREFATEITGLKIPDPDKVDQHPASFSYVCPDCYRRFLDLRNEIVGEAERKKKELEDNMDPDERKYNKMKDILANGSMTSKNRQEIIKYLNELNDSE